MVGLNLATDAWVAVADDAGHEDRIPPWQVLTDPRWTRFAFPRPDLNGIAAELVVALHQTLAPPPDAEGWRAGWKGHDEAAVRAAFEAGRPWFFLDGEHPFLQDASLDTKKPEPLGYLDSMRPGENTWKNAKDHFVLHDPTLRLPQVHAAMFLYAQQAWSPTQAGRGHLSGIRGNSPAISLLRLDRLSDTVWANLLPALPASSKQWLPWTREDPWGLCTPTGDDVRERLWRMPRRYRLVFDGESATGFVSKPAGQQHGEGWEHPYTPQGKRKDGSPFPVAAASLGETHRDHVVVTLGTTARTPSQVVHHNRRNVWDHVDGTSGDVRVWTFGYRFINKLVRGWMDHDIPALPILDGGARDARGLLEDAVRFEESLCFSVCAALRSDGRGALLGGAAHKRFKNDILADVRRRVEATTQPAWDDLMAQGPRLATAPWEELVGPWVKAVQAAAVDTYRQLASGISEARRGEAYHDGLLLIRRSIRKARKELEGTA